MSLRFYNPLAPAAGDELNKFGYQLVTEGPADVVICRSASLHDVADVEQAQIVARAGVGTGNVPVDRLADLLIPVVYAPGGNADSVAEMALAKLLAAAKNLQESEQFVASSDALPAAFEKVKGNYKGLELKGKSILIHGFGNIACRFAALCAYGLGMKVYVLRRPKEGKSIAESLIERLEVCNGSAAACYLKSVTGGSCGCVKISETFVEIEPRCTCFTTDASVIGQVDFHSVHIGAANKNFINAEYIAQAKTGSILINTDRGVLVDEAAVLAALSAETPKLKWYYTDFAPANLDLRRHPRCFSSPHTAASTPQAMLNCANMVVDSILNYMFDGKVLNSKNFPTMALDRLGLTRIAVASTTAIDQAALDAAVTGAGLTLIQKGEAANAKVFYTVVDVKEAVEDAAALGATLAAFGKVRVLPVNPTFVKWAAAKAGELPKANFYAGPAVLPAEVIEGLAAMIKKWDSGLSLVETSHRTPWMVDLFAETKTLIRSMLDVPDTHDIVFIQGGATMQMTMIPLNVAKPGDKTGYVETGTWAIKAIADAKKMHALGWSGEPVVLASNKAIGYRSLPEVTEVPQDLKYLWLADNETIHGLEYWTYPPVGDVPMVLDMSSNIFSRKVTNWEQIGCIFAGAQKNSGIAGTSIVIIRNDWIAAGKARGLPAYLDFSVHSAGNSMYNTPPVAAIASINLTMKWLAKNGGVDGAIERNKMKADMLYGVLDDHPDFFKPFVSDKSQRSNMNVVFNLVNSEWEAECIAGAAERGMVGLKGHRSLGGMRASIYNACTLSNVKRLCDWLMEFRAIKLAL